MIKPASEHKLPKSFSISPDILEGIETAAKTVGVSRSSFMELSLKTYLKHFNAQLEKNKPHQKLSGSLVLKALAIG
jgi:hypothetical protein